MRLTEYLHKLLVERLNEHRIVVWYDGERVFGDFVRQFKAPLCRVVSAKGGLQGSCPNALPSVGAKNV